MTTLVRLCAAALSIALLGGCSTPATTRSDPCEPLGDVETYIDRFQDVLHSDAPPAERAPLAQAIADDLNDGIASMTDGDVKTEATLAAQRVQAHADALAAATPTGIDAAVVNTAGDAAGELAQLAADCYVPEGAP